MRLSTSLFDNMPSHKYLEVLSRQFAPFVALAKHSSDNNYSPCTNDINNLDMKLTLSYYALYLLLFVAMLCGKLQ